MNRRKIYTLCLLLVCLFISVQPMVMSGSTYWDVSTHWSFYSGTGSNSGPVSFASAATFGTRQITSGTVRFTDLSIAGGSSWGHIGFHAPLGATMQVSSLTSNIVSCTIDPGVGTKTWKVYVGTKGTPVTVTGADSWGYSVVDQTVSLYCDNAASVELSWVSPIINPIVFEPPAAATGLLDAIQTNFVGGVIAHYIGLIGSSFWVFIALIALLPLYNRIGIIPIIAIVLIVWADLMFIIPAAGLQIGMAIIILGGAAILTMLFFARRRQYG